ncbi:hypothetical protein LJX78_00525 [Methanimicrococcus blatticola]|uniref:hypothetical protein n=1 Tax=Methanimicrococcus blatticola TaxID=91560 RepID=UPI001E5AB96B|nr:hypothetical protein [Methanimicrococcus blatticola]MCC2508100.1 hypothetical protein [Methanimicrococcus blatticola]
MSAQLRASALFYHTRSLTRTEVLLPCRLRYCCYLAVCVAAVTVRHRYRCPSASPLQAAAREHRHFKNELKHTSGFNIFDWC